MLQCHVLQHSPSSTENEAFHVGIGSRKLEGKAFDDYDELYDEVRKSSASRSKVRTHRAATMKEALFLGYCWLAQIILLVPCANVASLSC
jgi:hypothetical protein